MWNVDTVLTRRLLRDVHADVRAAFPQAPNLRFCASVVQALGGVNKQWFVEINMPGFPRFTWDGRAHNALEARAKAWRTFLEKHRPANTP